MKYKNLRFKIAYELRNYYMEHKYIIYLPLIILVGFIIGIIVVCNNDNTIANFIDLALEDEYNFGGVFLREFSLYVIVLVSLFMTLFSRYFHILSISSLLLVGYRFGYILSGLVVGGVAGGIVQIIIVNIPFILVASIILCFLYSFITGSSSIYCITRRGKSRYMLINLSIYTIIYIITIIIFHILVPKFYILIFL